MTHATGKTEELLFCDYADQVVDDPHFKVASQEDSLVRSFSTRSPYDYGFTRTVALEEFISEVLKDGLRLYPYGNILDTARHVNLSIGDKLIFATAPIELPGPYLLGLAVHLHPYYGRCLSGYGLNPEQHVCVDYDFIFAPF
jgi:hypothetical protein